MNYDLAIIGAGPGGTDAAEHAAAHGLKVILFEKNKLGGVCLNEGCIPTKTLLRSAHLLSEALEGKKYGVTIPEASFDLSKVMSRKTKILKKLGAGIRLGLQNHGVEIVTEEARLTGKTADGFTIAAGESSYSARRVIIATGSKAFIPPIDGLSDVPYWTAREALEVEELPKSIVVLGGGVIGMEFVSLFSTLGVDVTVVEMLPKILGPMDEELSTELQQAFEKRKVKFHLSTKVTAVRDGRVIAEHEGEQLEIPFDKLLVSVGRRAVTDGLGLETVGVELNRGAIVVDEHLETSVPGIYAVGDVNGVSMLAHTAAREGQVAVHHITDYPDAMSYRAIPGIVYTDPEIASVGQTEQELRTAGVDYQVHRVPMSLSGRFVIENEQGNGFCKLLTDSEGVILGAHMLGNGSSEILVPAIMAVEQRMTLTELARIVFPHPTVSEIVRVAALS